jgi:crotonobetainyl-CoA:carnitine CoA-transferase CaiB-like acyl-CoA transferase
MTQDTQRPAPLAGVRIVDCSRVLAGPYATYQLALLGAQVIKVEEPGKGDWTREGAPILKVPDMAAGFASQNADKQSITLDLKSPAGLKVAQALIASADVVVENFSPGVAKRLGIGYEAARALRPNLVYCSLSGFGQDGEFGSRPAYDHVVQAISGITMLTGTPQSVPNRIGPPLFDYLSGAYGAFAILAALRERDRTGQAQYVDVAMLDASIVAMASVVSGHRNGGTPPKAAGNTAASGSPASGIFPTSDGLLGLAANQEHQVARLLRVLGIPQVLEDERFAELEARKRHAAQFGALLIDALARRSAAEWEALLAQAHVPAARVRTLPEVLDEPHIATRGVEQQLTDPLTGQAASFPSIGFKWNGQALGPRSFPPRLGEHTDELLRSLGYTAADIAALRENKVV